MKKFQFIALFFAIILSGCSGGGDSGFGSNTNVLVSTSPVARDASLPAASAGPYSVASTNIEFDAALMAAGTIPHDYLGGNDIGGTRYYINTILTNSADTFQFNVVVPNDNTLYGSETNATVPYVGYILYPTTTPSTFLDFNLGTTVLPGMHTAGQTPVFENNAAKYPLVIYSHGQGSQPLTQQQIDLAQLIASQGYIVCMLFHGDNRFPQFSSADLTQAQSIALRPLAVKTAIDALLSSTTIFGAIFSAHIDATRIGGVGESFGGSAMAALQGAQIIGPSMTSTRPLMKDARIKASANIVPFLGKSSGDLFGLKHKGISYMTSNQPYMAITGALDNLTSQSDYKEAIGLMNSDRYLISISNESHAFTASAYSDASAWILQFLEAYVKKIAAAKSTLEKASSVDAGGNDSVL